MRSENGTTARSILTIPMVVGSTSSMGFVVATGVTILIQCLNDNGRIVRGKGFCVDDFTDQAMVLMEKSVQEKKPFFVYLPFNTPHSPMQVPERFWKRFSDRPLNFHNKHQPDQEIQTHKRSALAMCENLDWNVGRVLEKIDALKIAESTVVVWFHDNGPNGVRWNGGMKGKKGSTDEGGVRSPLYIRWPGVIEPGTKIPQIASARDLLPTLCDLANISLKNNKPIEIDGVSLKPLLLGQAEDWPDRVLINHWKDQVSARSQQFRLDKSGKLFDMIADPSQSTDVAEVHREVFDVLTRRVKKHRDVFMADYFKDDRPFVIAHPESFFTQLPARDAVAHGGIERSNRYPNCSYLKNWKSTDDKITCDAEVAAAGKFKVVLYYAAKDAGADCTLSFNDARLRFQIKDAHDVPELGAEHDRHRRIESYVKDFKALPVGEIDLKKGEGVLTLQATNIPGDEAMEFRLLTLQRVQP